MTVNELAIAAKTDSSYIELLWLAVYRLICLWANRYVKEPNPRYDADDLIQAGYFGLLKAVEQYPADSPYKFTTYLRNHCRNEFNTIMGTRSSKREPYVYSLDQQIFADENYTMADTVEDTEAAEDFIKVEEDIYTEQLHVTLEVALNTIPEQQKYVIEAYFYEGKTFKEIAGIMGCANSYPQQVQRAALRALRHGKAIGILREFDYRSLGLMRTGYAAFRYDMQSSVESVVLKKLKIEENARRLMA